MYDNNNSQSLLKASDIMQIDITALKLESTQYLLKGAYGVEELYNAMAQKVNDLEAEKQSLLDKIAEYEKKLNISPEKE